MLPKNINPIRMYQEAGVVSGCIQTFCNSVHSILFYQLKEPHILNLPCKVPVENGMKFYLSGS